MLVYQCAPARRTATRRDRALLRAALQAAEGHHSGGTWHIVAYTSEGNVGRNQVSKTPHSPKLYPPTSGRHAESALVDAARDLSGQTVAVAGMIEGRPMATTVPCSGCAAALTDAHAAWVVAFRDGQPVRFRPAELC